METYTTYFTKQLALAKHLKLSVDEIDDIEFLEDESGSEPVEFTYGQDSYHVLTDEEATERCKDYIKHTLYAFNPEFIHMYVSIDIKTLEKISELRESANPVIKKLLGEKLDDFIESVITYDGRGHFLASYDGQEHEEDDYFIYKL